MSDDSDVGVETFERYRQFLDLLARLGLPRKLRTKLDPSDLVQLTLAKAHRKQGQRKGHTTAETAAWLRSILATCLTDQVRKYNSGKRKIQLERSLSPLLDQSTSCLDSWLAADQSSPSEQAMRSEQLLLVADAIANLPPDQRRAVELRHLRGYGLAEIATEMETTKSAVANLIYRGIKNLRDAFSPIDRVES